MLKVDFYESADGETIIVTFPDGGLGVVDAHPSSSGLRPPIASLVKDKNVHFVCLTHPHADHGLDLLKVFDSAASVSAFWHTSSDVRTLLFAVTQQIKYPSANNLLLDNIRVEWATFLVSLYKRVTDISQVTNGFVWRINASRKSTVISDVKIHFLGPEEFEQNRYVEVYRDRLEKRHRRKPDDNAISAIIALEYAGHTILLGSDALVKNWTAAIARIKAERLGKVSVLKIPHHGARNAHSADPKSNYLELCKGSRKSAGVLFAGDIKHPHPSVYKHIKNRTHLLCLTNGLKDQTAKKTNPLNLAISGAIAVGVSKVCNPHVGYTILPDGTFSTSAGAQCEFCAC